MIGGFKVPAAVKSVLIQEVKKWSLEAVTVTASGLHPVERAITSATALKVHGADTGLLAYAIGSFYSGGKVEVALAEAWAPDLDWLAPYMETPIARLATVLLFKDLATSWMRRDQNAWYARIAGSYRRQFEGLHAKQVARLETTEFKLAAFHQRTVMEAIHGAPEGHGLILIPPQALGTDKNVQELFGWEAAQAWKPLNFVEAIDAMMARTQSWAVATFNEEIPGLEDYLAGRSQTTNRGQVCRVYSGSRSVSRLVTPHQEVQPCMIERLGPQDEITPESTISLRTLGAGEFQALRSQYLNRNIKPGAASKAYGVLVDGKLAGVFAFVDGDATAQASFRGKVPLPAIYQMTDFPVDPTHYKRLAKLIILSAASFESRCLVRQDFPQRTQSVITTAFSHNPVSMKYRGVYDLLSKKEDLHPKPGDTPFRLNYGTEMGKWTLKEGLATWCKKHAETGKRTEAK